RDRDAARPREVPHGEPVVATLRDQLARGGQDARATLGLVLFEEAHRRQLLTRARTITRLKIGSTPPEALRRPLPSNENTQSSSGRRARPAGAPCRARPDAPHVGCAA